MSKIVLKEVHTSVADDINEYFTESCKLITTIFEGGFTYNEESLHECNGKIYKLCIREAKLDLENLDIEMESL